MYTLEDVRKEYDRLDKMLGIDTSNVPIKKMKGFTCYGQCVFYPDTLEIVCIKLNKELFECCEDTFYKVARHEYTHMADLLINKKYNKHNSEWMKLCALVGGDMNEDFPPDSDIMLRFRKLRLGY